MRPSVPHTKFGLDGGGIQAEKLVDFLDGVKGWLTNNGSYGGVRHSLEDFIN